MRHRYYRSPPLSFRKSAGSSPQIIEQGNTFTRSICPRYRRRTAKLRSRFFRSREKPTVRSPSLLFPFSARPRLLFCSTSLTAVSRHFDAAATRKAGEEKGEAKTKQRRGVTITQPPAVERKPTRLFATRRPSGRRRRGQRDGGTRGSTRKKSASGDARDTATSRDL